MPSFSRRQLLTAVAGAAIAGTISPFTRWGGKAAAAEPEPTLLRVETRTIEVNGKAAKGFGLVQRDGPSH